MNIRLLWPTCFVLCPLQANFVLTTPWTIYLDIYRFYQCNFEHNAFWESHLRRQFSLDFVTHHRNLIFMECSICGLILFGKLSPKKHKKYTQINRGLILACNSFFFFFNFWTLTRLDNLNLYLNRKQYNKFIFCTGEFIYLDIYGSSNVILIVTHFENPHLRQQFSLDFVTHHHLLSAKFC